MRYQVGEVIDHLEGTCETLDTACAAVFGKSKNAKHLTTEELKHINENIFCCKTCGWWFLSETRSKNNPKICEYCEEED